MTPICEAGCVKKLVEREKAAQKEKDPTSTKPCLSEDVIRFLIAGVIKGVAYLHDNDIVHREL